MATETTTAPTKQDIYGDLLAAHTRLRQALAVAERVQQDSDPMMDNEVWNDLAANIAFAIDASDAALTDLASI